MSTRLAWLVLSAWLQSKIKTHRHKSQTPNWNTSKLFPFPSQYFCKQSSLALQCSFFLVERKSWTKLLILFFPKLSNFLPWNKFFFLFSFFESSVFSWHRSYSLLQLLTARVVIFSNRNAWIFGNTYWAKSLQLTCNLTGPLRRCPVERIFFLIFFSGMALVLHSKSVNWDNKIKEEEEVEAAAKDFTLNAAVEF